MLIEPSEETFDPGSVAILTPWFISQDSTAWDPKTCAWGGGERYLIDLARLLRSKGFKVHLYQSSKKKFEVDVLGFPLRGLGTAYTGGTFEFFDSVSQEFARSVAPRYTRAIYFNATISTAATLIDLAITHGVWWDSHPKGIPSDAMGRWRDLCFKAHTNPGIVVSVDSNSINCIRSLFGLNATERMAYIPNYADEKLYSRHRVRPLFQRSEVPRVLFPRRLVPARGVEVMLKAAESILSRAKCEIRFVGEGPAAYKNAIDDLGRKFPGRVSREVLQFDGMDNEYFKADISVVPTLSCEGTSLSLIESMAAGCCVVCSHVGGLSDLVIGDYNGIVVDPVPHRLADAIVGALNDKEKAQTLANTGREVFESSFTHKRWEDRWVALLRERMWL
jgi:glycosyltransferase involved in cell wall biosynthesis